MRVLFVCPLLLAPIAAAQPPTGAAIVAKLVSDLLPLKLAVCSDDPLKDDVYTRNELQSVETYSQSQAMKPFEWDLAKFRFEQHPALRKPVNGRIFIRSFIGPDQSYKLAYVLTGKDLSEANLASLVEAIVAMVDSVDVCRETESPLQNSAGFRSAAEKARDALEALGIGKHDVHVVMDSLFRAAIRGVVPLPTFKYQ